MEGAVDSAVLEILDAGKSFRSNGQTIMAFAKVTVEIKSGEMIGLVGPDGAGKTTLLRLMAGLLKPDRGTVSWFGIVTSLDSVTRARIGYMPQRFGLYEDLTVVENLKLFGQLHGLSQESFRQRQIELLAFTGLGAFTDRLAGRLSGGMKQKLGLACAIMGNPVLLLLDEPTVGVDPISRRELWRLVDALRKQGTAIVWSTAYLDEAARCDRIIVLQAGTVIAEGAPEHIIDATSIDTVLVPAAADRRTRQRDLLQDGRVLDAVLQGSYLRVVTARGNPPEHLLPAAEVVPSRLEDAVISLLRANTEPKNRLAITPLPVALKVGSPAILASDLTCRFGSFLAVNKVSFEVARGEIFGLLGPNGAGKSTIFRMLCGLLEPSAGTARVAGIDLRKARAQARQRIGYMAQRFSLYGDLTGRENLQFIAGTYGIAGRAFGIRLEDLADRLGLRDVLSKRCDTLSLGHKQRISLAAAILHEPEILFLDEPTSGVDPMARREFWMNIGILADNGVAVLVTSHFLDEAESCDRIAIIDGGRLLALDTPAGLRDRSGADHGGTQTLDDAFISIVQQASVANPS